MGEGEAAIILVYVLPKKLQYITVQLMRRLIYIILIWNILTSLSCTSPCPESLEEDLAGMDAVEKALKLVPLAKRESIQFLELRQEANMACNVAMQKYKNANQCIMKNNNSFNYLSVIEKCVAIANLK